MFEGLLKKLEEAEIVWPPLEEMPRDLEDDYTLSGRIQVQSLLPPADLLVLMNL